MGKKIQKVKYNPRTSSTKIKDIVLGQFLSKNKPMINAF
jgi:hypothetical protein